MNWIETLFPSWRKDLSHNSGHFKFLWKDQVNKWPKLALYYLLPFESTNSCDFHSWFKCKFSSLSLSLSPSPWLPLSHSFILFLSVDFPSFVDIVLTLDTNVWTHVSSSSKRYLFHYTHFEYFFLSHFTSWSFSLFLFLCSNHRTVRTFFFLLVFLAYLRTSFWWWEMTGERFSLQYLPSIPFPSIPILALRDTFCVQVPPPLHFLSILCFIFSHSLPSIFFSFILSVFLSKGKRKKESVRERVFLSDIHPSAHFASDREGKRIPCQVEWKRWNKSPTSSFFSSFHFLSLIESSFLSFLWNPFINLLLVFSLSSFIPSFIPRSLFLFPRLPSFLPHPHLFPSSSLPVTWVGKAFQRRRFSVHFMNSRRGWRRTTREPISLLLFFRPYFQPWYFVVLFVSNFFPLIFFSFHILSVFFLIPFHPNSINKVTTN